MNLTIAGLLITIDINSAATIALGVLAGMVSFTIMSNIVSAIRMAFFSTFPTSSEPQAYYAPFPTRDRSDDHSGIRK